MSSASSFADVERDARVQAERLGLRASKRQDASDDTFDRRAGIDSRQDRSATRLIGIDSYPKSEQVAIGSHVDDAATKFQVDLYRFVDRKRYAFRTINYRASRYPQARDFLMESAGRYRPLSAGRIPGERGFCLNDGIFIDSGTPEINESFVLVVKFPKHPGLQFHLDGEALRKADRDEPSLARRADRELATLAEHGDAVRVLKRGEARYADQGGFEIAIAVNHPDLPGGGGLKYTWMAEGRVGDVVHPTLEAELMTGQGASTGLDEAEVAALWKRLMESLRIRPSG
ncbi:hypothetical protein GLE_0438 [Lysobacter enzymogenes]|uniref:Tle cognate immunity protein 4 C-terminal domain-containing protein n=1 Tax=Lysobacter enzymogenes TaxID=69 RepID=A0A0S2DBB4_LYSEN|nr:hypothetical protein GLE_0438 [Lysobacter enzymogenes]